MGKEHANHRRSPNSIPRACYAPIYQLRLGHEVKHSNSMTVSLLIDMYRIVLPCNFELSTSRQEGT